MLSDMNLELTNAWDVAMDALGGKRSRRWAACATGIENSEGLLPRVNTQDSYSHQGLSNTCHDFMSVPVTCRYSVVIVDNTIKAFNLENPGEMVCSLSDPTLEQLKAA
jgi:peroxiredoxin